MNIKIIFIFLIMMICVGFYMLIERKILGYFNNRLGPNKIIFMGLFQFIMDLIKLLSKENIKLIFFIKVSYYFFFFLLFMINFLFWFFFPFIINLFNLKFFFLLLIMLFMNKILIFINLIWIMNSIYSLISVLRLIIQNFSYEILFMLIFFFFFFFLKNFNLILLNKFYMLTYLIFYSLIIFYFWLISALIELNRIPFDYFESESELISGFNIEYSSFNFMILFLIEYLDMIFLGIITLMIFMNFFLLNFYFYFFLLLVLVMILFFRGFLIRYRIDKMFNVLWKLIFPLMFNYFIFFLMFIYL